MKNPKSKSCKGNDLYEPKSSSKKAEKIFQEIRTVKGEKYHPSILYNIAMMIQIYINERVDNRIKTLEDNDFHGFMSQFGIPNTFSFTGAVFNNCTINFK